MSLLPAVAGEAKGGPKGWATIEAAGEFAAGYKGVGIVIFQGRDVSHSPDKLGRAFVAAFKNLNVSAQYFTDDLGKRITSISFFLNVDDVIGPFNYSDAAAKIREIAEKHRVLKKYGGRR